MTLSNRHMLLAATAAAFSARATSGSRPTILENQAVRNIIFLYGAFADVIDQAARSAAQRAAQSN